MSLNREEEPRTFRLDKIAAYLEEARVYLNESRIPREYTRYTSGRFGCYRNQEFDEAGKPLPNAAEKLVAACAVKLLEAREGDVVIADLGAMFGAGLLFVREAVPEKYRDRVRLLAINQPGMFIFQILEEAKWRLDFSPKRDYLEEHAVKVISRYPRTDYEYLVDGTKPILSPRMYEFINSRLEFLRFIRVQSEQLHGWVQENLPGSGIDLIHEFAGGIFWNPVKKSEVLSSAWASLNPDGLMLISRSSVIRESFTYVTDGGQVFPDLCSANPKDPLDGSGYYAVVRRRAKVFPLIAEEAHNPVISRQTLT